MTGAIICGGKSVRMGRPKAGMVLKTGVPMIQHVCQVLRLCCPQVVLCGDPPELPSSMRDLPRISDRIADAGPIGGLEALLSSGLDREYLVVPCDLPRLQEETLQLLTAAKGRLPMVLVTDKHVQPLVARYGIEQLPEIRARIGQGLCSLKALLHEIDYTKVPVPPHLTHTLRNVNTVRDFIDTNTRI